MTALSVEISNSLMNLAYKGTAYAGQSTVYCALHTAVGASDTSAAWAATELVPASAVNYLRVAIPAASWGAVSNGVLTNVAIVTFAVAGASWGTITHFSTWTASGVGAGTMLHKGALGTPRPVPNGDQFTFPVGLLQVGLD